MDESEIESLFRSNAPGKWEQIKKAASIAQEHRRRVKEGDLFIFLFPLAAAMAKDAIFDFIPVLGTIFGVFITVYLFVFMWGRGRLWLRFVFFIVAVLDLIPFINLIPFNTASVVYAFLRARKDADQSQAALSDMERQAPRLKNRLQTQAARMARAAELQEERMNRQAANDATGPAETTQERPARAPQMASFSGSGSAGQQSIAAPVAAAAAHSATRASAPVMASSRSSSMGRPVDGAQMQLAHMRGRAANDPAYGEAQPARQQTVSGSDIVSAYRRPQLTDELPSSKNTTRISSVSAGPSTMTQTPQASQSGRPTDPSIPSKAAPAGDVPTTQPAPRMTPFKHYQGPSDDASARIREAGSRLAQLSNPPGGVVIPTAVSMVNTAAPVGDVQDKNSNNVYVKQRENSEVMNGPLPPKYSKTERSRDNLESVSIRMGEYRDMVARLNTEVSAVDSRLSKEKSSLLNRIVKFRAIRRLEYQKSGKLADIQSYQKFLQEDEGLRKSYEGILAEESARENLVQEELRIREAAEKEKIALEESERDSRDVGKLMTEHNAYFIHNIVDDAQILKSNASMAEGGSFNPALDKRELDWSDRIDIVSGIAPTLSVSTISKPEHATYRQDKSTFTLLLKGGRVLAGSQGDLWTVAKGLKERTFTKESAELENIEKAIKERGDTSYNELVVADPELAGIAFYWPTNTVPEEFTPKYVSELRGWDNELIDKYNDLWEKIPKLREKKMDIFVMVNNQPRILYDIDVSQRSFKVAAVPDMPRNTAYRPGIGDSERKAAMDRVIDRI